MNGLVFVGLKLPTECKGCSWRDPEYGGACILMPGSYSLFRTYNEQYGYCPIRTLAESYVTFSYSDLKNKGEL